MIFCSVSDTIDILTLVVNEAKKCHQKLLIGDYVDWGEKCPRPLTGWSWRQTDWVDFLLQETRRSFILKLIEALNDIEDNY